ncbi:hypothetical protein PRZ48_006701 [Zasmidium cellare]|uniref:Uncharacterized protein n=1 Tax=Zasmidium cellare TaxID=395010 RepID=A0ABR0ER30_ZASCE|nr:hypothetical protein PRZ48_006701 [Zasmidium cellare]
MADGVSMCNYQKVNDDSDAMIEFYDSLTGRRAEEAFEGSQTENVPHATQTEIGIHQITQIPNLDIDNRGTDEAVAKAFRKGYQQAKDENAAKLSEMKQELEVALSYKTEFFEWKEFMEERRKELDTREATLNEREQTFLVREAVEQARARGDPIDPGVRGR